MVKSIYVVLFRAKNDTLIGTVCAYADKEIAMQIVADYSRAVPENVYWCQETALIGKIA